MTRIRQHVNPLTINNLIFKPDPINFNCKITEVELGCAEGDFLFNRHQVEPDHLKIGLEIREPLVKRINKKADKLNISRYVRGIFCNINIHFKNLFPPESVDRFFLNFPDPWFKTSHKKRRVFTSKLLQQITKALKPGGEFFIQTDVFELALESMFLLESEGWQIFTNQLGEWSFMDENPYGAQTRREKYVTEDHKKIWRMLYIKS
ncbi:MAG: tRNA (guanosine(46)-N7)-methyltransferase TrmB [Myxococcota bacterium]